MTSETQAPVTERTPDTQPEPRRTQTWIVYDDGTESMYF